ncbi:MAG: glutamine--tRNA ligase/YqeY domain fusion protein [Candidatus Cloacimonetes bacterium]|nr:glutamine--tRNA ligase/YqeY domain fusion protein [Candidatus Cloacimonadota bacterium]
MDDKKILALLTKDEESGSKDFIRQIIEEDIRNKKHNGEVHTRFPPEPNGFLHIGHAKAICLNYGLAVQYNGKFNLRFDDTNPIKEETKYVEAILEDMKWLGTNWEDRLFYASDYFPILYDYAIKLIEKGKAYVDDLNADEIREYRGTLTEPGKNSPFRDRSIEENLDLFERMKNGEFPEGEKILRAKIDMAHPNMNMRDPVMYRILHREHHRTGDTWCIYPTYDFTHGESDSIERITYSLCDIGFENHRPLYNWFINELEIFPSRQIEFARLNLSYTILSKRKLIVLVEEGYVNGWDDPRMPTISGLRRRGYTAESIWDFLDRIGMAKSDNLVDYALLEHCIREELNKTANRYMAVLKPLKIIIDNYPEDQVEELEAVNNPEDESAGTRKVPFSKELYIERDDFMEDPPKKFYRLAPGREVRLRYAYFLKCNSVVKDDNGNVIELHCSYDPKTKGGNAPDGRKVKATLHWVSAKHAIDAEVRLYEKLFVNENPNDAPEGKDFTPNINPHSFEKLTDCKLEPALSEIKPGDRMQFERKGYFCCDKDSTPGKMIFNRTVTLKDDWQKIQKAMK